VSQKRNSPIDLTNKLKEQFALRSDVFDESANWITDKELIRAHIDLAGKPSGRALDLCCGTGQIGRSLKAQGWDVRGLDICEGMVEISSRYFPVSQGAAEKITFESNYFHLVVCRQTFQFLNAREVLSEIARVLEPNGIFILSLTVPFCDIDYDWLYEIHRIKQPLLLKFYTAEELVKKLESESFSIEGTRTLTIRESITRWMQHAPELSQAVQKKVLSMVENAPPAYKKLHNVEIINGEVLEDWNWVIFKAVFHENSGRAKKKNETFPR